MKPTRWISAIALLAMLAALLPTQVSACMTDEAASPACCCGMSSDTPCMAACHAPENVEQTAVLPSLHSSLHGDTLVSHTSWEHPEPLALRGGIGEGGIAPATIPRRYLRTHSLRL